MFLMMSKKEKDSREEICELKKLIAYLKEENYDIEHEKEELRICLFELEEEKRNKRRKKK